MNCYRVWTVARSTAHRTVRRVVRHVATHPIWVVSIVCVGVPLATLPLVPYVQLLGNPEHVEREYEPWNDRGEWPVDRPIEIPSPGMISILPGILVLALSRRKPI